MSNTASVAALILTGILIAQRAVASESAVVLPQSAPDIHNGVASCATSVCHGKASPVAGRNVWLNEYHVWSNQDHHARAYRTLLSEESKAMAKALGLPAAHTAKVCLDCHADNVAAEQRGKKFQLSDGVGCEACHGGSERWLKAHIDPGATHRANLALGMFPSEDPYARAALCLGCHLGTADKFAHHEMMAAGHPRLAFELDTFTANQPAHYAVDQDYKQRKGEFAVGYLWIVGQVESARRLLALIEVHGGRFGARDLAVLDCHACHHPMKPRRGQPDDLSAVLPVGSLRLLDYPFDMLAATYEALLPAKLNKWQQAVRDLHLASVPGGEKLQAAATAIRALLPELEQALRRSPPQVDAVKALRRRLAQKAAAGRYADFSSAEQAFLALESLSYGIGDREQLKSHLDAVYSTVGNEHDYNPEAFRRAIEKMIKRLDK